MPRYHFDIDDGQREVIDGDGNELSGPDAAQQEALALLTSFAQAALNRDGSRDVRVMVRDDAGVVVYTATMTLRSKWVTGQ